MTNSFIAIGNKKPDENYGSGIRRIREAFEQYGLKAPKFENFQHGFRIIVHAERLADAGETSGKIIAYIHDNPDITIPELARLLGITERSVERNISQFQEHKNYVVSDLPKAAIGR